MTQRTANADKWCKTCAKYHTDKCPKPLNAKDYNWCQFFTKKEIKF